MINCSKKSFLIVENIKQSRDTIKLFTYSIGAEHVDITHRASNVISMCEYTQYDIIFLGYDLGENKKNGQQILEELRVKNLISRHCSIIMITAEVSQAMVLAALEHKPDEYLVKPYSLKDIKLRLSRSLSKKSAMEKIYTAMDEEDHKLVLSLTANEIAKNSAYKSECLGIMSRQYFELEQFNHASKIYDNYKGIPNCQWAHIGLGKIALAKNDLAQAKLHFQSIIDEYPLYLSAYDWLAKTLELEKQTHAAEQVLENAMFISPRSVKRLKKYAELCVSNENYDKATGAYLKTNELAQNSIHKQPENAILFAQSLLEYSETLDKQETKKLTNKAHKALNTMTKEFPLVDLKIISNLLSSRMFLKVNDNAQSKALLSNALKTLADQKQNLNNNNALTISSALLSLGKTDEAEDILTQLAMANPDNTNLLAHIVRLTDNPISDDDKCEAQNALELGIKLYKAKELSKAIDKLNQALSLFPSHIGIKLNLLQVLVIAAKNNKARTKDQIQIAQFLEAFDLLELATTNETFIRYNKLKQTYHKIKSIQA